MTKAITGKVVVTIGDVEHSMNSIDIEVSIPLRTEPFDLTKGYPDFIPDALWNYCQSFGDLDVQFGYYGMWNGSHFNMGAHGRHKVVICLNQVKTLSEQCGISLEESGLTIFAHEVGHYFDMKNRQDLYTVRSNFKSHEEMRTNQRMIIDCELGANYELMKLSAQFGFVPSITLLNKGLESQHATPDELGALYDILYHGREYEAKSYEYVKPKSPYHVYDYPGYGLKPTSEEIDAINDKIQERVRGLKSKTIIIDEFPHENPQIPKEYTDKQRKQMTKNHFKEIYNGKFDERTRRARNVHKRKF